MPVVIVVCKQHHSKIKANTFTGYHAIKRASQLQQKSSKFVSSYITDLSLKALTVTAVIH